MYTADEEQPEHAHRDDFYSGAQAATEQPQPSLEPSQVDTLLREEIERLDREALECAARRNDAEAEARGLRELYSALPRQLPPAASAALLNLVVDARRARKVLVPRRSR